MQRDKKRQKETETRMAIRMGMTVRKYKRLKRKEYNRLLKDIRALKDGCAAMPNYSEIREAMNKLEHCAEELRAWWKDS
jgi:hypothetical protein